MDSIKFIEQSHRYVDSKGNDLISVSAFVKKFEPKKDWTKIAAKVAKKEGKEVKEILNLWELKRIKGSEAGTTFHNIREAELLNMDFFEFESQKLLKKSCEFKEGCKFSIPINNIENGYVYPELMIYNFDHMICGQSDKIIIENGKIHVYDYKTDKSIDFKAFSSQWVKPEKLLAPVNHLENCNGNIYALKMSTYMYLLWKANKGKFKPGKIILEWCPLERDEQGIPILYNGVPKVLKEEIFELPYLKKEVEAMLKALK